MTDTTIERIQKTFEDSCQHTERQYLNGVYDKKMLLESLRVQVCFLQQALRYGKSAENKLK